MILKIRPQTKSETMLDKIREKLDTPFFFYKRKIGHITFSESSFYISPLKIVDYISNTNANLKAP